MIRKVSTKKIGALVVHQIHPMEVIEFRLLLCQGKAKWEGQEVIDHRKHLSTKQGSQEDCAS